MTPNPVAVDIGAAVALLAALVAVGLPGRGRTPAALAVAQAGVALVLAAHGADLVAGAVLLTGAALAPLILSGTAALTPPTGAGLRTRLAPLGVAVAALAGAGLAVALHAARTDARDTAWALDDDGAVRTLARTLVGLEALPLGVCVIALLAGAVGLVTLGRRDERERAIDRAEQLRREREDRDRRRREDRLRARGRLPAAGEEAT